MLTLLLREISVVCTFKHLMLLVWRRVSHLGILRLESSNTTSLSRLDTTTVMRWLADKILTCHHSLTSLHLIISLLLLLLLLLLHLDVAMLVRVLVVNYLLLLEIEFFLFLAA